VHALQERSHGAIGLEEVIEDPAIVAERLLPPVTAFADRIFQMSPEPKQNVIRIKDVADERTVAVPA
jgi:hypothetical protein